MGHAKKQQAVAGLGARMSGCRPRCEPREGRGDVFVGADVANEPHPQRREALDAAREVVPSRRCWRRTRPLAPAKRRRRRRESRGKRPRERCTAGYPASAPMALTVRSVVKRSCAARSRRRRREGPDGFSPTMARKTR